MKKLLMLTALIAVAFMATACATTQSTQVAYVQSCAAYGVAFDAALHAREAGKLNKAQIDQVSLIDKQITPICTGPLPADPQAATVQITAAVTTLGMIEAIKKAGAP